MGASMNNFFTQIIQRDHRYKSTECVKELGLLEPGFRAKVIAVMNDAKANGYDLRVLETYRSQWRQHMLYMAGKTELSRVGVHGFGLGVDLGLFVDDKYQTDGEKYMFFVKFAKNRDLITGIDWGVPQAHHGFKDYDHLQGVPLHRQSELFNGHWYPSPNYNALTDIDPNSHLA
jgi:hypothetical protein